MPPKRPIGGSGNAGAAKALEDGVEMETEVAITADELSLHTDVFELPQRRRSSTPTPTTTPAMTPMTTLATTLMMTDSWLVIYTHLCVK